MMKKYHDILKSYKPLENLRWITLSFLLLGTLQLIAQENPPIPISVEVSTAQFLNFGTFTTGTSGGNVSVDYDGLRTATGDVVLLNFGPTVSPALYDVTANPGTIISITHPTTVMLSGSNGGSIGLSIDSYSKGKDFLATANPPSTTPVYIGGTLSIGNLSANPAGQYSGFVTITFIQQ